MRFIFKTEYDQDIRLVKHGGHLFWYGVLMLLLLAAPWLLAEYWLAQLTFVLIYSLAGLGLMLLAGYTGLFSLGHAAFLGVGAYTQAVLTNAGLPFYFLCLVITVVATLGILNLLRAPTGRAFVAIRDSEISAQSMGIHLAHYKTLSFALSAGLAGVAGALYAHQLQFISPDQFNILQSIDLLLMVVVGGLGSVHGAFLGAIFLIIMPQAIAVLKDYLPLFVAQAPGLQGLVYGLVLIAFVLFEPMGLYGRWLKVRTYLQLFPFYRQGLFKRQKSFQKSDRLR